MAVLNGDRGSPASRARPPTSLQSTGYNQAAVDNNTTEPRATLIGYKSGADAAAQEIAKLLDVPAGQIQPMDPGPRSARPATTR